LLDGEVFPVDKSEEFSVGFSEILERLAYNDEGAIEVGGVGNPDQRAETLGGLHSTCVSSPVVGEATASGTQKPRQRSLFVGGYIAESAPCCFQDYLEDVSGVSRIDRAPGEVSEDSGRVDIHQLF